MSNQKSDPFGVFAFKVDIDGIAGGFFQEVSGLGAQIDVQDVQEGGRNNSTRKLVGQGKFPNLILKRGFCNETLLDALMGFHSNKTRLNGTITLRNVKGDADLAKWEFKNGIPVKWDGPQLNVSQNAIAIESLEISHEGLVSYSTATTDRTEKAVSQKSGPPPASSGGGGSSNPGYEDPNASHSSKPFGPIPEDPVNAPSNNTAGAVPDDVKYVANASVPTDPFVDPLANASAPPDSANTAYELKGLDNDKSDWQQWGWQDANSPTMVEFSGPAGNSTEAVNTAFELKGRDNDKSDASWFEWSTENKRPEMLQFGGGSGGDAVSDVANAAAEVVNEANKPKA
jgi:phage tail-like protein